MKFSASTALIRSVTVVLSTLVIGVLLFGFAALSVAAPNYEINYQGKLTDTSGAAVADGTYNMRFWLLTTPSIATTSAEWTESLTGTDRVQVTNGLFSVMLGSTTPLTAVDFNQTLYLGVEVGGTGGTPSWDGEMSPRKILGAVPAAFEADNAQTLGGIATTSFLRSDQADTISATENTNTLLTITQNGTADIVNIFDGSTEVLSILDGGRVGIGTTSPATLLTVGSSTISSLPSGERYRSAFVSGSLEVDGGLYVDGALYDSSTSAGTNGYVLQTTGSGTQWVATSTLGIDTSIAADSLDFTELADALTLDTSTDISVTGSNVFSITNTGTGNSFVVNDAGSDTTPFVIDASGNVGVGVSSPNVSLEVGGKAAFGDSITSGRLTSGNGPRSLNLIDTSAAARVWRYHSTFGPSVEFIAGTNNDVTNAANSWWDMYTTPVSAGERFTIRRRTGTVDTDFFTILASGNVGIGTTNPAATVHALATTEQLRLAYDASNYWTDTTASDGGRNIAAFGSDADLNITFAGATDGDFSVNSDDLFVDTSTGFVGIGTTTPQSPLHIQGSSPSILFGIDDANGYGGLNIFDDDNVLSASVQFGNGSIGVSTLQDDFFLGTRKAASDLVFLAGSGISERVRIIGDTGYLGIGTTSPATLLTVGSSTISSLPSGERYRSAFVSGSLEVDGGLYVDGALYDSSTSAGTNGYVLQTTGSGTQWVATSTLGISGGSSTFTSLTDTQNSFTANRVIFTNSGATALTDSANFVFDGTNLGIGSTTPNTRLTIEAAEDTALLALSDSTNASAASLYVGTSSPASRLTALRGSLYIDTLAGALYQNTDGSTAWSAFVQGTTTHSARITKASQSIPATTFTKITFDTIDYDVGGLADVSTNNRIDIQRSGKYIVTASARSASVLNNGDAFIVGVNVNGTGAFSGFDRQGYSSNRDMIVRGTDILDLEAGDYIEVSVYHEGTTASFTTMNLSVAEVAHSGSTGVDLFTDAGGDTYLIATGDNLLVGTTTNAAAAKFVIRQQNANDIINVFDGSTEVFTILDGGDVGIGTDSPVQTLQVFGDIRVGDSGTNGCLERFDGTALVGTCASDQDLKTNIVALASSTASTTSGSVLERLVALTPVTYSWNETAHELYAKSMDTISTGLIAQNVEEYFPELVSRNEDDYRQVNFTALPYYIIQAIKEMWAIVTGHDERIVELETENAALEERLQVIEAELNIAATHGAGTSENNSGTDDAGSDNISDTDTDGDDSESEEPPEEDSTPPTEETDTPEEESSGEEEGSGDQGVIEDTDTEPGQSSEDPPADENEPIEPVVDESADLEPTESEPASVASTEPDPEAE